MPIMEKDEVKIRGQIKILNKLKLIKQTYRDKLSICDTFPKNM